MKKYLGVSYFSCKMPEHFEKDIIEMKDNGMNEILLTFSENDMQFYSGTYKTFVEICHKYKFRVYFGSWGVGGIFGGEAYSKYASVYYENRQILSNGERPPFACMNNPHFRRFFIEWIKTAIECGADYLFFDEPHFFIPSWSVHFRASNEDAWGCRCKYCQKKYFELYGEPMPKIETDKVRKMKKDSIFDFIKFACEEAKKIKKEIKTSVCLITDEDFLHSDIPIRLAKETKLDELGTDPYWLPYGKEESYKIEEYLNKEFKTACEVLKKVEKETGKEIHLWIKNFNIKKGTEKFVGRAIEIANDIGINNILAWSYKGTKYMSSIACDDPNKVWKILTEKYKKIRNV